MRSRKQPFNPMTQFATTRKNALIVWKTKSNRVFKSTDNFDRSFECKWQDIAYENGYNHISLLCSLGSFVSHLTDILRDYRYDKYEFDQSEEVNEIIFRYYSRVFLIASEIFTDFQDLYILAANKFTIKSLRQQSPKSVRQFQGTARKALANNTVDISDMLDYINKICKHKVSNFHVCNNHIKFLFQDFHLKIKQKRKRIEIKNINQYTTYDEITFEKKMKPNYLVIPKLDHIITLIINGYAALDKLFMADLTTIEHICNHFEDK